MHAELEIQPTAFTEVDEALRAIVPLDVVQHLLPVDLEPSMIVDVFGKGYLAVLVVDLASEDDGEMRGPRRMEGAPL